MACIVTGFPSQIAALQFEYVIKYEHIQWILKLSPRWALQNPHLTLHIPPDLRISHSTGRKRNGHPKRPALGMVAIMSNMHLLLRVPSFQRWPLDLRFFVPEVFTTWKRYCHGLSESLPSAVRTICDFETAPETKVVSSDKPEQEYGLAALDVCYENQKEHVAKAKAIIDFEREGRCTVCEKNLEHDQGIYVVCSSPDCDGVSHMNCMSQHFLKSECHAQTETPLVPTTGSCPKCKTDMRWVDLMKEVTLRLRGQQLVDKLLKPARRRKGAQDVEKAGEDFQLSLSDKESIVSTQEEMPAKKRGRTARSKLTTSNQEESPKKRRGRPAKSQLSETAERKTTETKRSRKSKAASSSPENLAISAYTEQVIGESCEFEDIDHMVPELKTKTIFNEPTFGDAWDALDSSDESDGMSVSSQVSQTSFGGPDMIAVPSRSTKTLPIVIEDSEDDTQSTGGDI